MSKTILQGTVKRAKMEDRSTIKEWPEDSERQDKVERYYCNVIFGAPTTVKMRHVIYES